MIRYQDVCLEALAYTLPDEVVTTAQIEARLEPMYRRLRLPAGRLEMITGIAERRFWPAGSVPSQFSIQTAQEALRMAGVAPKSVGALVHGSVCRDFLEPATACLVHHGLGLPPQCVLYDVSNACLGLMDGILQVANMIELGQIRAGVVVGTESSRAVVEHTIRHLNEADSLTRAQAKLALATLTLGSGSAAAVLVHREASRTGNRLVGGALGVHSAACRVCVSQPDESIGGNGQQLMWTDSDTLLREGLVAVQEAFPRFLEATGWAPHEIHRTFCHQIGRIHRKRLFETLQLDPAIDYPTVEFLGNTGSVAVIITAALGIQNGFVKSGDHVALWGIGSGINVLGLGIEWQHTLRSG